MLQLSGPPAKPKLVRLHMPPRPCKQALFHAPMTVCLHGLLWLQDKMDLSIGVALGSSIQIALFVVPMVGAPGSGWLPPGPPLCSLVLRAHGGCACSGWLPQGCCTAEAACSGKGGPRLPRLSEGQGSRGGVVCL